MLGDLNHTLQEVLRAILKLSERLEDIESASRREMRNATAELRLSMEDDYASVLSASRCPRYVSMIVRSAMEEILAASERKPSDPPLSQTNWTRASALLARLEFVDAQPAYASVLEDVPAEDSVAQGHLPAFADMNGQSTRLFSDTIPSPLRR